LNGGQQEIVDNIVIGLNIGEVAHLLGGRRGYTFRDLFRFKFFFTLNEQNAPHLLEDPLRSRV
jgi:hypothetical protein